MTATPTMPVPQALATEETGALSREWFLFLQALLTYAAALEARITALEEA